MPKKLSGPATPISKSLDSGIKPKNQPYIICSAASPSLTAARTAPEAPPAQGELLPPETVVTILNGFAVSLLKNEDRFELLKSNCLEGTKFGHDPDTAAGSILTSAHTVLTYLTWGIRHFEKALVLSQHGEKKKAEEHLKNSEQMLNSLIDSIQLELNDHPITVLSSSRVPHASFILGLAHVFLALVCKLRKNSSNLVASHLLAAFMATPNKARQSFIPELWNQLFRPHLSAVEVWYKKEHRNITSSLSRSHSFSVDDKPYSPRIINTLVSPITANTVICRANSLLDLVSGMRSRKKDSMPNAQDQAKLLDRMNKQIKFLSALYEESLDEGTMQYARHYQDLIVSYYGRFFDAQGLVMQKTLQTIQTNVHLQHGETVHQIEQPEVTTNTDDAAVPDDCTLGTEYDGRHSFGRGWTGANALQLRRSLIDAIFGTVPIINKTSKQVKVSNTSLSGPISSLLHLCSKQLPEVMDSLKSKGQTDNCIIAASSEGTVRSSYGTGKVTTVRDVVNTECSLIPEQQDTSNMHTILRASITDHSLASGKPNGRYLPTNKRESGSTTIRDAQTQLTPTHRTKPHLQTSSEGVDPVTSCAQSRRLIDFIQDKSHQSDTKHSPLSSAKINNQPTRPFQMQIKANNANTEDTKLEEQRIMRTSNSETYKKINTFVGMKPADQELKAKITSTRKVTSRTRTIAVAKTGARKQSLNRNLKHKDMQFKYNTSLREPQTRSLTAKVSKSQFNEGTIMDSAPQTVSNLQAAWGAGTNAGNYMLNHLLHLANEMRTVVQATRSSENVLEGMERCEEVLLRLSQAWLECKSATLIQQQKGVADKEPESVAGNSNVKKLLDSLTDEFLFILANSRLQEAQRLALCLLTASIGFDKSNLKESALLPYNNSYVAKNPGRNKPIDSQILSDPSVFQAISHLLQQRGCLPEAALLLHLLHPTQYSASCLHFLPRLLPLLLELALHNALPRTKKSFDHSPNPCSRSSDGHLQLRGEPLKTRALALMMMSRLLAAVDTPTRLQACKHVLVPNANTLPCLLSSFDCAQSMDEKIAAAFILTTCMQTDDVCKNHIVNHVQLPSLIALLQQTANNGSAFHTNVNFVSELLRTRKASISEVLQCIHRDDLLNCMHALMAYLQTASLENRPPAAGLLLQLDLLLGDERTYSVFREEALEALLLPFVKECSMEATFTAARVLSTSGSSQSEQQLEAWLLHKAGLGAMVQGKKSSTRVGCHMRSKAVASAPKVQELEEAENESAVAAEWDQKVACSIIAQRGGELVSNALSKGMRSSSPEVRKSCLLVAAWLAFHLGSFTATVGHRGEARKTIDLSKERVKQRMREALQGQLQEIAAEGSGSAIAERVFAALALQNLSE